jgi:hypothetical protein
MPRWLPPSPEAVAGKLLGRPNHRGMKPLLQPIIGKLYHYQRFQRRVRP